MRKLLLTLAAFFLLAGIWVAATVMPAMAVDGKVILCHLPPGNPTNARTITVSQSAVPAHLAHGDLLGTCERS